MTFNYRTPIQCGVVSSPSSLVQASPWTDGLKMEKFQTDRLAVLVVEVMINRL